MIISYDGNYPTVEINFSLNEKRDDYSIKLPMSKMWYKNIIYEIEKVAEEEKKQPNIYMKTIGKELRKDLEMDSEGIKLSDTSEDL